MKQVFKSIIASGVILGGASVAQAADLSVLYDNTVEMTASFNGTESSMKYHYNEDGTVKVITAGGESDATWAVNGDEMCTTMTDPSGNSRDICNPVADMEGASVGGTWEFSPADGLTITGALVAGR